MRRLCLTIAFACLAASFAAIPPRAARAQVAPPSFRALRDVGPFSANQVGRWDGTAQQFLGGPATLSSSPIASSDLLSGLPIDYYYGNVASPASYSGPANRVTQFYSRLDAPGDANARAGTFELRGIGNNPALDSLTGAAYYTGSGTSGNLRALAGLTINQRAGTSTLSEGVLGLSSNTGIGTTSESDALRGRVINSAGTTISGRALHAEGILTGGHVAAIAGLDMTGWQGGALVDNSYGILIDNTIDQGAARHCILSSSTSPSDFAGDVAFTDAAKGVILKDSVTSHFVRLTLANGVLTQTDLGTGTP